MKLLKKIQEMIKERGRNLTLIDSPAVGIRQAMKAKDAEAKMEDIDLDTTLNMEPKEVMLVDDKDEEDRELCDFCQPFGRPCCMGCLLGGGGRKLRTFGPNGNVHGFAP